MLTIDFVAKRYGKLPSEVMRDATTFDVSVADLGENYKDYLYKKSRGEYKPPVPELTQEQMLEMVKRVKEQQK